MATAMNVDDDSEDLWEISAGVFDNYNEDNVLKHFDEKDQLRTDRHHGFDNNSGDTWIYPTNYPIRKYQHDIVYNALFKNTLVCLPTGLGKTFIAAVVMYNFYRWYPQGKLIFMAPTKPLVAQQIDACYQIMGISKEDTAEITGQQKKENRLKLWKLKRVFYATPQSVVSDIDDPNFPIQSIKLVVIDEAHKAKGKYAYCEVIRIIKEKNEMFRVLALSATPGQKTNDVAEVVHNLWISNIEVRTEKCPDVVPYVHSKRIETIVVRLTDKIRTYREELLNIIDPYVQNLLGFDVIAGSTRTLHKGWLVVQKQKYNNSSLVQTHPHHSAVLTDFACCISLYHALELLEGHGLWTFLNFFDSSDEKFVVAKDYRLKQLLSAVREDLGSYPFANGGTDVTLPADFDFGHPKYNELLNCLSKYFTGATNSQAIVFCEYRDSAFLIHQMLLQRATGIRPAIFIGQGSTSGQRGITQRQQIATMADFRQGVFNVLIATCVAEEGIDCGEVDLIVCFDVTKNPIRLVQRMGRTGRKRNGMVCLLVSEGKEHGNLKDSMTAKDYTNKKLATHSDVVDSLCPSPRLVPTEFNPKCVETFILAGTGTEVHPKTEEDRDDERRVSITSNKRSTLQAPTTSTDLRNFFRPITNQPTVHRNLNSVVTTELTEPACAGSESSDDLSDHLKVPTFWEVMENEKTSSALKAYAIKCNISAWKEKLATKTLAPVHESIILNTIGDASCVSKLLNGYQRQERPVLAIPEFDQPNEPYGPSFAAKLADRFNRHGKIQKMEEKSDVSSTSSTISQTNDTLPMDVSVGTSEAFIPFYDKIESKYEDVQVASGTKMFPCNTPVAVKRIPLKSSTPLTSKRTSNKSFGSIKDSPLARAFEKCKSLNESKKERKRERKMSTLTEALAFLGIRDVMDIFVDPVECSERDADSVAPEKEMKVSLDKHSQSTRQKPIADKHTAIASKSVTHPTSQEYTVSQILKIVNLSQKSTNGEKSEINHSSTPNKSAGKEIFIGTIEDIFGSYDSVECDKPESNGKQCTRVEEVEEEDVIASSQPVISEIKLPSKYLSNYENKIPSNHLELDNGDDMFASFAKTNSPIPTPPVPTSPSVQNLSSPKNLQSIRFQVPSIRPTTNTSFKSPSPNNSTVKTADRSPSVFSRKINLTRLKALSLKSNSERMPSNSLQSKSPLFLSCRSLDVKCNQRSNEQEPEHSDDGSELDEPFKIHRNRNKRNRIVDETVLDDSSSPKRITTKPVFRKPFKKCHFIDDECDVSDGSSDDEHDASDAELNSIICNEEVHDDTSVDMRAIYMQSVKSPVRKNGFRMANPKAYLHNTNIFSQTVVEENESDYDTSFVVDECSENEENEQEMSVLERAEWLLKKERREKRKKCNNNSSSVPKRRKIIAFNDSSDDNT
ncbi:Fanconi anemia group M protein isoform X2 [Bradysia coprophila]|uniref:Fanconi anemia group M protein isoform X2 n=1 Tax=Bradysia coprophila TaxID=38358 RepID=UPI00187D9A00|nr:Fanconi anemia group M protein isoform X2 [Bradysia coprophila]